MAAAYSLDLRQRVVVAYDEGLGANEISQMYRVSRAWVYKMLKQRRETGCIQARKGHTGPKPKLAAHRQRLKELVGKYPDATLAELRQHLRLNVSLSTIWLALCELGLTLKKSHAR